jgi:U3 small nucleolar RNA-associated protein 25
VAKQQPVKLLIKTNDRRSTLLHLILLLLSRILTMAKKSSVSGKKNKGPKGKKARAKAKLEKQWGEHVDEDELKRSKQRQGPSRLLPIQPRVGRPVQVSEQPVPPPTRRTAIDSDDDEDQIPGGAFSSLLKSISKSTKQSKARSKEDEVEDEEIDDMPIDDDSDEEEGEGEETEQEETITQLDDENGHGTSDPFSAHFARDVLPEQDAAIKTVLSSAQNVVRVSTPALDDSLDFQLSQQLVEKLGVGSLEQRAEQSQEQWTRISTGFFQYNRQILKQNWRKVNKTALKRNPDGLASVKRDSLCLNNLQSVVYPSLASYADVMINAESTQNRDSLNNIITLHILNHILTSRGRVQRNNKRAKEMEDGEADDDEEGDVSLRDQGYTRPTVLVLLPTRGVCHSFVKTMLSLLGDAATIEHMDRFETEYGPVDLQENEEELDSVRRHRKMVLQSKGKEWNGLFGDEANSDDDFKIGVSFSPKTVKETDNGKKSGVGVRLYTDFYKSDMIVASPLAVKMATDGSDENAETDIDYLTSIEVCLIGSSDVLMMQNWDHVNATLNCLNQQPTKNNNTDFSRVREYLLAGQSKYWRQLIVCSKFTDPSILSTFKRNAASVAGILKLGRRVPVNEASLVNVMVATKQVFQRVPCKSFATQGAERLEYFVSHLLPEIQRTKQKHTMIYVPSYFEFISLRNLFLKKELDFVSVTEYARPTEVTRGRTRFLQGRKPIMLYTGRAHFFSRHTMKGARRLIFFGLPEHAEFYSDVVNMLNLGIPDELHGTSHCLALFTRYEAHALERICGRQNGERMLKGEKSTYMFVS